MQAIKTRPRRVTTADGPEVAILRYFRRFPQGSHLGFAKWRRTAEKADVNTLHLHARNIRAGLLYRSGFGAELENLLVDEYPFVRKLYFSGRRAVVMAMIYALLDEQKKHFDRTAPVPKEGKL
jgi:hypothetical protein